MSETKIVPIELYRPSNGSEGAGFHENWCTKCERDKTMNGSKQFDDCGDEDICKIIGDTFAYDVDDPKYPQEWRYDDKGRPTCTAFVPVGTDIHERCKHTVDMFDQPC